MPAASPAMTVRFSDTRKRAASAASLVPQSEADFVSRLFAPNAGIPEDPVTGSAHTVLGPFWARRLGRTTLVGMQASWRPGLVGVTVSDTRVVITGRAVTVVDGVLKPTANPV